MRWAPIMPTWLTPHTSKGKPAAPADYLCPDALCSCAYKKCHLFFWQSSDCCVSEQILACSGGWRWEALRGDTAVTIPSGRDANYLQSVFRHPPLKVSHILFLFLNIVPVRVLDPAWRGVLTVQRPSGETGRDWQADRKSGAGTCCDWATKGQRSHCVLRSYIHLFAIDAELTPISSWH